MSGYREAELAWEIVSLGLLTWDVLVLPVIDVRYYKFMCKIAIYATAAPCLFFLLFFFGTSPLPAATVTAGAFEGAAPPTAPSPSPATAAFLFLSFFPILFFLGAASPPPPSFGHP